MESYRLTIKGEDDNQITLLKKVGKGSYGDVFLAKREAPGGEPEEVAVKVIDMVNFRFDRVIYEQEYLIMSRLQHKNLVSIKKDLSHGKKNVYIVMEYCNGGTLKNYI